MSTGLEMCIFLRDGTGHEFNVEGGKRATAQELCTLMQTNLNLPPVASELFCMWLTSPLLKLQLKPHHVPYKLFRQWPDLLDRFTSATEEQKNRDEPILCYQRNAFFPKGREKRIRDPSVLDRLYHEAKDNILEGYYPCTCEEYDKLAGYLARIDLGPFNINVHTPAFFRERLAEFYPAHSCKTSWSLPVSSKTTAEYRIIEYYKRLSGSERDMVFKKLFLETCWSFPFYGSVFFNGQIEKPVQGRSVRDNHDRPVYVAINREGVFITDIGKCDLLLSLSFDDLSWEYTEPAKTSQKATSCLPCLWLQFDSEESGQNVSKLLQVFSKQAVMMNAMIEACVEELNKADPDRQGTDNMTQTDGGGDTVDAAIDMPLRIPSEKSRLERLSLATVSDTGVVIQKPNKRPLSLTNFFRRQDSTKGT
ncbi:putative FERM domain-containing protein FRMD8P1 isoform X2 [Ptychodera flava]|uniref:putative FERM domain-containing protein FRMD8P1 isoform X2 n=1 Tax=Ptychodera flava TaxID=63121 RepID=UPI003969FD74